MHAQFLDRAMIGTMNKNNSTKYGVLAVVGASFLYGMLPIFMKEVLLEGMPENTLIFYRFLFTAVFALVLLGVTRTSLKMTKRQFLELTLAALIGYGATAALLTNAYTLIPVGLATMFHFTNPLFVNIAMILLFKEKPTLFKGISVFCAILGLVFMADFSSLRPLGVLLATLSGVTYASYVVANKKCSFAELDSMVVVFFVGMVNLIIFGTVSFFSHASMAVPSIRALVMMVILSLFCTIGALYLLTYGIRTLGASKASVLNMLEPVVSLIAGMIVYHETASIKILLGCLLIVISGIVVVKDDPVEE